MTVIIIISTIVLAGGAVLIYSCTNKTNSEAEHKKPVMSRAEAIKLVQQLEELGYYKYADPKDIDSLKEDLTASIAQFGILSTIYFDKPVLPKDYRYYMLDGESVFEEGGFNDAIKDMKTFFEKAGLKLEITNQIEDYDTITKGLNHELTVNGKRYIIFKNFKEYGWGEAVLKFAEMINDQMQIQGKSERLYLINGGNDGNAVFLTDEQFQIIDKLPVEDEWKALKPDKWREVFKLKPMTNI